MPSSFYYGKSNNLTFVNSLTLVSYKTYLKQLITVFFILVVWSITKPAFCEDTLQSVMARMKPEGAVAINYQENRYLSLMSDKWTGEGRFYALLPDVMIKEQQLPEKELMAIRGNDLYYFNQENGQKHQGQVTDQNSQTAYVAAFKGLMNGDVDFLTHLYDIEFIAKPSGWIITLNTKKKDASSDRIQVIMQGQPEQVANKLELIMEDGDHTEFLLGRASSGETVKLTVTRLFDLLGAN
jgi:hypothetical protein